ncbi:unnamed protein product [Rhizophagus irregularis]|nr:unnamed protein product [Rhizophagus irregularis]
MLPILLVVVLVKFIRLTGPKEILGIGILKIKNGSFHACNTVVCFGITQDPNTKDYMMVLQYFEGESLRNNLVEGLKLETKIKYLFCIIDGLSGIHDAGNIHKDFHSGNKLLYNNHNDVLSISDLGMCQPVNDNERKGIYGVIPYMAPEVLRGYQYTKAADIYYLFTHLE